MTAKVVDFDVKRVNFDTFVPGMRAQKALLHENDGKVPKSAIFGTFHLSTNPIIWQNDRVACRGCPKCQKYTKFRIFYDILAARPLAQAQRMV